MPRNFSEATMQGLRRGWRRLIENVLGTVGTWVVIGIFLIGIAMFGWWWASETIAGPFRYVQNTISSTWCSTQRIWGGCQTQEEIAEAKRKAAEAARLEKLEAERKAAEERRKQAEVARKARTAAAEAAEKDEGWYCWGKYNPIPCKITLW